MLRPRRLAFFVPVVAVLAWPIVFRGQTGAPAGEWRAYGAWEGSTRYSALDQITRDNVQNLRVAWTWRFDNYGTATETLNTETTPLMVNGVLYFTAGPRRTVVAAN